MERGQTKLFFTLFSVEQWLALLEVIFSYDFISSSCQDTKVTAIENVLLPSTNLFIDLSSVSEQVPTGLFFFSGCHQFYLEPSSLSGYFKTELLSLSHRALITHRAKREARRNDARILFSAGMGLAWLMHMRMCLPSETASLIYYLKNYLFGCVLSQLLCSM